jgi:hypothetical protein
VAKVVEHLSSKALSSNPVPPKKRKPENSILREKKELKEKE